MGFLRFFVFFLRASSCPLCLKRFVSQPEFVLYLRFRSKEDGTLHAIMILHPSPFLTFPRRGKEQILPPSGGDVRRTEGRRHQSILATAKEFHLKSHCPLFQPNEPDLSDSILAQMRLHEHADNSPLILAFAKSYHPILCSIPTRHSFFYQ